MRFRSTITIKRSPAEVFAYLADFENVPTWNYAIVETRKVTEGPVGVGRYGFVRGAAWERIATRCGNSNQDLWLQATDFEVDRDGLEAQYAANLALTACLEEAGFAIPEPPARRVLRPARMELDERRHLGCVPGQRPRRHPGLRGPHRSGMPGGFLIVARPLKADLDRLATQRTCGGGRDRETLRSLGGRWRLAAGARFTHRDGYVI